MHVHFHSMVTRGNEVRLRRNLNGQFVARMYFGPIAYGSPKIVGYGETLDFAVSRCFDKWVERERLCNCQESELRDVADVPHESYCAVWRGPVNP